MVFVYEMNSFVHRIVRSLNILTWGGGGVLTVVGNQLFQILHYSLHIKRDARCDIVAGVMHEDAGGLTLNISHGNPLGIWNK